MKVLAVALLFVASCSASAWYNHPHYAAAPVIHNGVPVDTPEVQHAKAAHAAAHAAASHGAHAYVPVAAHYAAVPAIHNGVPVDTPEVQHAKAAHFAAHAAAAHGAYAPAHQAHYAAPVIHNGVPVDTPEVQHAKAAHFAAVAEAQAHSGHHYDHVEPAHYAPAHYASGYHSGAYHVPIIHNGVPVETPEVQHAKAAHFAAVAEAQAHSGHHYDSWAHDNSWDNGHHDW